MWGIAQVAHQKWVTMSNWLRSLRGNERLWVNCSGRLTKNERIAHFFERIAHSLIFGQKRSDSLGKLMSEFPALCNMLEKSYQNQKYFNPLVSGPSAGLNEKTESGKSCWKVHLNRIQTPASTVWYCGEIDSVQYDTAGKLTLHCMILRGDWLTQPQPNLVGLSL